MKIIINGSIEEISSGNSISKILEIKGVVAKDMVSVQLNDEFVKKEDYDKLFPKENDSIDFLYFMGGGQS